MTPAGLSTAEARHRLAKFGPNEPAPPRRGAAFGEFLTFLANPLVVILLVASVVSALVGDAFNALIIVVMVILSVVLNFVQTNRSHRPTCPRETINPRFSI